MTSPGFRLHPLHRLWRLLPTQQRRRWVARATALIAPRPDRRPPPASGGVAVVGELSYPSGLGEGARLMLQALERLGVPSYGLDIGTFLPGGARRITEILPDAVPLVVHVNSPQMARAMMRLPRALIRGRRIIGYWAWELPTFPPDWREGAAFVHEIWATSHFTAEALEPILPGRVRVVTHPLAFAPPVPSALGRRDFGLPDDAVLVLASFNLASSLERKNPLGMIAAFRAAFGDRADRILVLKLGNPSHFQDDFARIRQAIGDAGNIRLETRTLEMADNYALMAACDIVLSLHRSEGFGRIPAEGMLLGRPVVATGWSGNMDFMDADSADLVGYRLIPAVDPRGVFEAPGAVWADPDIDQAGQALRRLADDPAGRAELGARGKATATARLGPQTLSAALIGIGLKPPG